MPKTYIRIYGPPVLKALRALEGVAVDMSKITDVKFSHRCVPYPTRMQTDDRGWDTYLKQLKNTYTDCYEPEKIISDASMTLGEYDFVFDWSKKPSRSRLKELMDKVDSALSSTSVLYTMTTK